MDHEDDGDEDDVICRNDEWVKWTYAQYLEDVRTVAKAFIKLGLKPFHSVNILGFNAPEWHISAVAGVIIMIMIMMMMMMMMMMIMISPGGGGGPQRRDIHHQQ